MIDTFDVMLQRCVIPWVVLNRMNLCRIVKKMCREHALMTPFCAHQMYFLFVLSAL